ncbi:MAG: hypothetical protein ACR2JV_06295 [Gaiellales bacterium]
MSRRREYGGPVCPVDEEHGALLRLDLSLYCPNRRHEGLIPFFTAELVPVARSGRARPPAPVQIPQSERVRG